MFRGLICHGVHYFMRLYMCVYYVKRVNMSMSPLFHVCVYYVKRVNMSWSSLFLVFILCVCTMLKVLICQGVYYFMCLYVCVLC